MRHVRQEGFGYYDANSHISTGMMLGMGLVWVLVIILLIAAVIKYLRS
jgi:hypothetical protein